MPCTPATHDPTPGNTTTMSEWIRCVNRRLAKLEKLVIEHIDHQQVFTDPTPPPNPAKGDIWVDPQGTFRE